MYPVNQVIVGGDPMLNSLEDLDIQIQKMEAYRQKLKQLKGMNQLPQQRLVWDEIDAEISPLTETQKQRLMSDKSYVEVYTEIQQLVQQELLNLVKGNIENSERGKELLKQQLTVVRKLKDKIIADTNNEMLLFNKFKEFSKANPNTTYEEFVKQSI